MRAPASRFLIIFILVWYALLPARTGNAMGSSSVLLADISIQFVCRNVDGQKLEVEIGDFLMQNGFEVLNQGLLQRKNGVYLQALRVIGIHEDNSLIEFMSLPHADGRYVVRLNTRPPTRRASSIEDAIENFTASIPNCQIRQISRGENSIDAIGLFEQELARVKGLLRQADELNGRQRI